MNALLSNKISTIYFYHLTTHIIKLEILLCQLFKTLLLCQLL